MASIIIYTTDKVFCVPGSILAPISPTFRDYIDAHPTKADSIKDALQFRVPGKLFSLFLGWAKQSTSKLHNTVPTKLVKLYCFGKQLSSRRLMNDITDVIIADSVFRQGFPHWHDEAKWATRSHFVKSPLMALVMDLTKQDASVTKTGFVKTEPCAYHTHTEPAKHTECAHLQKEIEGLETLVAAVAVVEKTTAEAAKEDAAEAAKDGDGDWEDVTIEAATAGDSVGADWVVIGQD